MHTDIFSRTALKCFKLALSAVHRVAVHASFFGNMRIREDTSSQIPNGIANVQCRFLGRAFLIIGARRCFLAEQLKDAYVHFPFGIEMF